MREAKTIRPPEGQWGVLNNNSEPADNFRIQASDICRMDLESFFRYLRRWVRISRRWFASPSKPERARPSPSTPQHFRRRHHILRFPSPIFVDVNKDCGFRILDSGFRIPDSGFQIPDSGFRSPDSGFRNPESVRFRSVWNEFDLQTFFRYLQNSKNHWVRISRRRLPSPSIAEHSRASQSIADPSKTSGGR